MARPVRQSSASARRTTRKRRERRVDGRPGARGRARALDDAGMTWADIDAVVIGKAPDVFEGVMMPELYLADALGAAGKPMYPRAHRRVGRRLDVRSSAAHLVESGRHERVLAVAYEKQSEGNATWALSGGRRGGQSAPAATFAPYIRGVHRAAPARPSTSAGWSR